MGNYEFWFESIEISDNDVWEFNNSYKNFQKMCVEKLSNLDFKVYHYEGRVSLNVLIKDISENKADQIADKLSIEYNNYRYNCFRIRRIDKEGNNNKPDNGEKDRDFGFWFGLKDQNKYNLYILMIIVFFIILLLFLD